MFLTNFFEMILSHAGKLFDILQCKQLDMEFARQKINSFIRFIEDSRNDGYYNNIFEETMKNIKESEDQESPPRKKLQGSSINHKAMYFEIIDTMLVYLKETFDCIQEFAFFELIDVTKFQEFSNNFPINHINSLQLKYPDIFEIKSLISELKYIYLDSEFRKCKSPNAVL